MVNLVQTLGTIVKMAINVKEILVDLLKGTGDAETGEGSVNLVQAVATTVMKDTILVSEDIERYITLAFLNKLPRSSSQKGDYEIFAYLTFLKKLSILVKYKF